MDHCEYHMRLRRYEPQRSTRTGSGLVYLERPSSRSNAEFWIRLYESNKGRSR